MLAQRIAPLVFRKATRYPASKKVSCQFIKAYTSWAPPNLLSTVMPRAAVSRLSRTDHFDAQTNNTRAAEDAKLIFNQAWKNIEDHYGRENIRLPREFIFLMGAPGSGKGTHTPSILRTRGITNPPISISQLVLESPECKEIMNRGQMISDRYVIELLLHAMLNCDPSVGVLVDGFPRTDVQAEALQLLHDRMTELRREHWHKRDQYPRPVFRICVLYVDEDVSIIRQLERGRKIKEHNAQVRKSGQGAIINERFTDNDEHLSRERYAIYQKNYESLFKLSKKFPFHLINATGTVKEVLSTILKEFEYQSSLELDSDTYDSISRIPVASDISIHARQDLVCRLEHYQDTEPNMLHRAIRFIEETVMPKVLRHSICGHANILSEDSALNDQRFATIVMDVLSERGYHVGLDERVKHVPVRVDLKTGEIKSDIRTIYSLHVEFPKHYIRPLEQKFN